MEGKLDELKEASAEIQRNIAIDFFDSYGNPSDPPTTDITAVLIKGLFGVNDLVVPLRCLKTSIGENICSFTTILRGNYLLKSSFFASDYKMVVLMGPPSLKFSEAKIDSSTSQSMTAGSQITFVINPRDSSGLPLDIPSIKMWIYHRKAPNLLA